MLRITVLPHNSPDLSFSTFERFQLPAPLSGAEAEINGDLILKFEDEEEASTYAEQLETLSNELTDKTSPQYLAISDIILSIRNDEFVQSYTDNY